MSRLTREQRGAAIERIYDRLVATGSPETFAMEVAHLHVDDYDQLSEDQSEHHLPGTISSDSRKRG